LASISLDEIDGDEVQNNRERCHNTTTKRLVQLALLALFEIQWEPDLFLGAASSQDNNNTESDNSFSQFNITVIIGLW
jgi:hypothetical protein